MMIMAIQEGKPSLFTTVHVLDDKVVLTPDSSRARRFQADVRWHVSL